MPHCQLYYHLVWTTKNRERWITPEVEPAIHGRLRSKAVGLGAELYALDGVEDHVHMVVSIPPRLSVAEFIGKVKGSSSTSINRTSLLAFQFYWQTEYGAYTVSKSRLRQVIAYVESQKQRHAERRLYEELEPPPIPCARRTATEKTDQVIA